MKVRGFVRILGLYRARARLLCPLLLRFINHKP